MIIHRRERQKAKSKKQKNKRKKVLALQIRWAMVQALSSHGKYRQCKFGTDPLCAAHVTQKTTGMQFHWSNKSIVQHKSHMHFPLESQV